MRGILTFIGGLAVGILAVTGVFAMEEEGKPSLVEHSDEEDEKEEDKHKETTDDDGELITRSS